MEKRIVGLVLAFLLLPTLLGYAQEKQLPYTKDKSAYFFRKSDYFGKSNKHIRKPNAYVSDKRKNPYAVKSTPYFPRMNERDEDDKSFMSELGQKILSTLNTFKNIINALG